MAVRVKLANSKLPSASVVSAMLHEACGEHSTVVVSIVGRSRKELLASVGKQFDFEVTGGTGPLTYKGIVQQVRHDGEQCLVRAVGASLSADIICRTRSFAANGEPEPVAALPGFKAAFSGTFDAIDLLNRRCAHATQLAETDWQFLKRLARLNGVALIMNGHKGRFVRTSGASRARALSARSIIAEDIEVSLGLPKAEALTWNWRAGKIPTNSVSHDAQGLGELEKHAYQAAKRVVSADVSHQQFLESGFDDAQHATIEARRQRAKLVRYRAEITDLSVAVGMTIRFPKDHEIDTAMFVTGRRVRFDSKGRGTQLSISIDAVSAQSFTVADHPPSSAPVSVLGIVVELGDATRLGLVRIRFPWQSSDATGMWCRIPQPFAGKAHGTYNLPAKGDWIVVLLWPESLETPLVLGSIYRGDAAVPTEITDLEGQRALLLTNTGQRIISDEKQNHILIGMYSGTDPACHVMLSTEPVGVAIVTSRGRIRMEADIIELVAHSGVTIDGKVSIR